MDSRSENFSLVNSRLPIKNQSAQGDLAIRYSGQTELNFVPRSQQGNQERRPRAIFYGPQGSSRGPGE
jgi:hypothetical protein